MSFIVPRARGPLDGFLVIDSWRMRGKVWLAFIRVRCRDRIAGWLITLAILWKAVADAR